MPRKISQLETATDITASDILQVVDIEDTGMAVSGTNKKITAQTLGNFLPVTATGSSASRSLKNRFADTVNVKDFGAVGDGVTDDTAAIQAAFVKSGATGQKLYVPTGIYNLSNTIAWQISNGFQIECAAGVVFKATSSFPVDNKFFYPSATSGSNKFIWQGGTLDGRLMPARGSGAPDLLYIATPNIQNVCIEKAIFICNDTRSGSAGDSCLFLAEGENYTITGCTFQGAVDSAIYTSGNQLQTTGKDCVVTNNFFVECNVGYIAKRLFLNQIVSNNILERCNAGIVVGGQADDTLLPGSKTIIANNILSRIHTAAIESRIAVSSVITGNRIEDYGINAANTSVSGYGILLQGSSHCVVSNNVIYYTDTFTPNVSSAALYMLPLVYNSVTYPATNNLLQGNVIRKCAIAILEGVGGDFNIISNNAIVDATTRFSIKGANTIFKDVDAVNPRLHTRYGSSGSSPTVGVHELIENDTGHLSQVLVPNNSSWQLLMGDVDNPLVARMGYDHSVDRWQWIAGGSGVLFQVDATGPRFGERMPTTDVPITGYIQITDTGGTVRKLAVIA